MWNGAAPNQIEDESAPSNIPQENMEELQVLLEEMRDIAQIRFATYRTASKLRFIQKKTQIHLVDIWNMIESFRENGLNAVSTQSQLKYSRLELLLTSVFHNLNKRLPTSQHIDTDKSISTLLSFLLGAYDRRHNARLTVFSVKIALAVLSAGKLVDKLRYIFSQISEQSAAQCFRREDKITLNTFLDVLMSETCPPCLMWLPLLHRICSVEHVYHPVSCDSCQVRSFTGFRYKCQRCSNYQLCQNCFWRGRTSQNHSLEHEMKEYSSYKSPTKQLAHSIHKSLQCIPMSNKPKHPEFESKLQRPLDLSNIVPVMPNSYGKQQSYEPSTEWTNKLLPGQFGNATSMDDEHKLIARYAAKLSGRTVYTTNAKPANGTHSGGLNGSLTEKGMIAQLEEENNEMLCELAAMERQNNLLDGTGQLSGLKEKKMELESRMRCMQSTRKDLMQQLEHLMGQLNSNDPGRQFKSMSQIPETLSNVNSRISNAFREHSLPASNGPPGRSMSQIAPTQQLQGDLLQAADAITSNVSELLHELDMANEEVLY
uniref:ZZ-type domain-containing protein n=1 Tax=Rhabditophanes sp. KR3021 TaxID=114890 RepID=A0AC35TSV2_9BILA